MTAWERTAFQHMRAQCTATAVHARTSPRYPAKAPMLGPFPMRKQPYLKAQLPNLDWGFERPHATRILHNPSRKRGPNPSLLLVEGDAHTPLDSVWAWLHIDATSACTRTPTPPLCMYVCMDQYRTCRVYHHIRGQIFSPAKGKPFAPLNPA